MAVHGASFWHIWFIQSLLLLQLDDGLELSFTDKRRFAKVRLLENVWCYHLFTSLFYLRWCLLMMLCNVFIIAASFCASNLWAWTRCIIGAYDHWWVYWLLEQEENWDKGSFTWSGWDHFPLWRQLFEFDMFHVLYMRHIKRFMYLN